MLGSYEEKHDYSDSVSAWESKWQDDVPVVVVKEGETVDNTKGIGYNIESCAEMLTVREIWNMSFQRNVMKEGEELEEELAMRIPKLEENDREILRKYRTRIDKASSKPRDFPDHLAFCVGSYCEAGPIYKQVNKALRQRQFAKFPIYVNSLLKALRYLPYEEEGTFFRGMSSKEGSLRWSKEDFPVNGLLTYEGFTSLSKNRKTAESFASDGVLLEVDMQTGRDISAFSPYDEAEVLLPPMTILQVKKVKSTPQNLEVQLEELQIWKGDRCVLWIDDNPRGNYNVMHKAEKGSDVNFVIVKTTEEAIKFMTYESNKDLIKANLSRFRVVTDMYRFTEQEKDKPVAGGRVIQRLRSIGYKETIMVFVGRVKETRDHLEEMKCTNYDVTNNERVCVKFCRFET